MATPSRPVRRSANVNVSPVGNYPKSSFSDSPARKSAAPFGSVDKSVHKHPSAPVSPNSVPVNDKDAGRAR